METREQQLRSEISAVSIVDLSKRHHTLSDVLVIDATALTLAGTKP